MSKYVPVYEYAKKVGKSEQEIYRLIREKRFKEEDVRYEEITKSVLRINASATPKK
jgi:hypothetical protein